MKPNFSAEKGAQMSAFTTVIAVLTIGALAKLGVSAQLFRLAF